MNRRVVGPFNRVEGDLEVALESDGHQVCSAEVVSPLYRGFEQILQGKDPLDALIYAPRICGICSVSQSIAAARVLGAAAGQALPRNGELIHNLLLATENIADHLSHFYLFFMPDFARETYQNETWYREAEQRFRAIKGEASRQFLPVRAQFLHLMGIMAGKWPHSLAIQPGGSTRAVEMQELARMNTLVFALRHFLEQTLFGDSLEQVVALDSAQQLSDWAQSSRSGDLRHFLRIAEHLDLEQMGRGTDLFMSYGAYAGAEGALFAQGVWDGGFQPLDQETIYEDISHSWMQKPDYARHPFEGVTIPDVEMESGYSWCKAPRLGGRVVEVGALARQQIAGHPLIRDLVAVSGGNVRSRVVARMLEVARVTLAMEQWLQQLEVGAPFCSQWEMPDQAHAVGMVEAARGSLGHWLKIKNGRILNYQIIAPTTWNFSPRDESGNPGALELALVGAPIREGEQDPVSVQHIVRSFDPCMVCTVH